jgi:DNA-binding NarL/FixJ family response regulator
MKTRTAKLKPAGVRSRASDSSQSVRVVVIDDHEVVRCGLRRVAEGASHHIVGEACTLEDGLQVCRTQKPDVVLLDIRVDRVDAMSSDAAGGSFELIGQIRVVSPETRVVVLTSFDNPGYVARAMAAGAHDYVLKGESAAGIIEAIEDAAAGRPPVRATNLRRIVGTARESQVLRQIALGLSNREIAETLAISVETVKEHVQNLLRKLALNDRTQAAVWAVRQGVVS